MTKPVRSQVWDRALEQSGSDLMCHGAEAPIWTYVETQLENPVWGQVHDPVKRRLSRVAKEHHDQTNT